MATSTYKALPGYTPVTNATAPSDMTNLLHGQGLGAGQISGSVPSWQDIAAMQQQMKAKQAQQGQAQAQAAGNPTAPAQGLQTFKRFGVAQPKQPGQQQG